MLEEHQVWQYYHAKTVLITGATGFIGTALGEALTRYSKHNIKVHGVARNISRQYNKNIKYHAADLTRYGDAKSLLESII